MKKLHVGNCPLTNSIYCGSVLKDGRTWGANKTDVTGEALYATAICVLNQGGVIEVGDGESQYKITVEVLK